MVEGVVGGFCYLCESKLSHISQRRQGKAIAQSKLKKCGYSDKYWNLSELVPVCSLENTLFLSRSASSLCLLQLIEPFVCRFWEFKLCISACSSFEQVPALELMSFVLFACISLRYKKWTSLLPYCLPFSSSIVRSISELVHLASSI